MIMGGFEKRRPKSRQRAISIESNFFSGGIGKSLLKNSKQGKKNRLRRRNIGMTMMSQSMKEEEEQSILEEEFDEHLGSPLRKQGQQKLKNAKRRRPYFVEYMAMTKEEKQRRLLWKKDYDKQQRLQKLAEDRRNGIVVEEPASVESEPPPVISHVGKRVWDYSGVPRLPNTTARLDTSSDDSDSDDSDSEDNDDDSSVTSTEYHRKERKNDPNLLRTIFPRPGAVDRRTWAKYGMRFHRLPKEQQSRAIKREKQLYYLDSSEKALANIENGIKELDNYRTLSGIEYVKIASETMQNILAFVGPSHSLNARCIHPGEVPVPGNMYCSIL